MHQLKIIRVSFPVEKITYLGPFLIIELSIVDIVYLRVEHGEHFFGTHRVHQVLHLCHRVQVLAGGCHLGDGRQQRCLQQSISIHGQVLHYLWQFSWNIVVLWVLCGESSL